MTAATWGCCPARRRPGELLTRGDLCHVHAARAGAERCGVLLGGAPELVRLDEVRPAVDRYRGGQGLAGLGASRALLRGAGSCSAFVTWLSRGFELLHGEPLHLLPPADDFVHDGDFCVAAAGCLAVLDSVGLAG